MTSDRVERRLAAILAADMVGYSRLMEADETGTIARQKAHREELIDPKIAEYHGRIVKTTGDGLLIEFGSAVDAVECAIAIQKAMAEREADVPEGKRIQYRAGINVGDIVIDGDDILGDGVNVAARLETLAEPGQVYVARNVFNQVRNKVDAGFEDLGEHQVKNIAEPVQVYRIHLARDAVPRFSRATRRLYQRVAVISVAVIVGILAAWQFWSTDSEKDRRAELSMPDRPSIAVLAFDTFGDDPKQGLLGDGLAEDITTELARNVDLTVIARHTSFSFKGKALTAQEIAEQLGVRYVLEGSVRRAGERLRVNAQLIDGGSGKHVWAERFDFSAAQLYEVQDEIISKITGTLFSEIRETEKRNVLRKPPDNLDVYELTLRGVARKHRLNKQDSILGHQELTRATELDPSYAPAWLFLGYLEILDIDFQFTGNFGKENYPAAEAKIRKAIELDPELPTAYQALAVALLDQGDLSGGLAAAQKAVQLGPGDADNLTFLAYAQYYNGQFDRALKNIGRAIELNPNEPVYYLALDARLKWVLERYKDTLKTAEACMQRPNLYAPCQIIYIFALVSLDDRVRAAEQLESLKAHSPNIDYDFVRTMGPLGDPASLQRWSDHMHAAGFVSPES